MIVAIVRTVRALETGVVNQLVCLVLTSKVNVAIKPHPPRLHAVFFFSSPIHFLLTSLYVHSCCRVFIASLPVSLFEYTFYFLLLAAGAPRLFCWEGFGQQPRWRRGGGWQGVKPQSKFCSAVIHRQIQILGLHCIDMLLVRFCAVSFFLLLLLPSNLFLPCVRLILCISLLHSS